MMKVWKCLVVVSLILMFSMSASAEKTLVTISSGQPNAVEVELMQGLTDKFMHENPDIEVKWQYGPQSATDLLGLYLQFFEAKSGEVDVMAIDVIWPGDMADNLLDLYQFDGFKEAAQRHFPAIVENNTVDGKLVGMPWMTDAGLLFYRTDLLEKYGYSGPPQTWDELEEMAKKIQEGERADGNADFWGFVWQGNAYEGLTCDALEWIKSSGGGSIVEPDGTISINNDAAVKAIERAKGWIGTISPPGVTGFLEEDARRAWQGGNAAFMRNWPYAYSLGNNDDSAVKGKFDATKLPGAEAGMSAASLGGWQIAVSKYSEHPEVAAKVALFLTSEEVLKARATQLSILPTIMDLYKDKDVLEARPFMGKLYDVFINAVARPSTVTSPNYNQVSTLFFNAVYDVLIDRKGAQTALEELELDIEDLVQ
jgi:trehalose/maltose transport system substrate-binding protein